MEQSNHNKKPSVKELIDYHHGNMSESQMHSIEKDALEDSFLDDALEGFKHDPHALPHIEQLRKKIEQKNKERKRGIWFNVRPYYPHMAVAATLFTLAFSAYFVLIRTVPNGDDSGLQAKKSKSDTNIVYSDNKLSNTRSDASVIQDKNTNQIAKEKINVEVVKPESIKNINVTEDLATNGNESEATLQATPQIVQKDDDKQIQAAVATEDLSKSIVEKKEEVAVAKTNVLPLSESRIVKTETLDKDMDVVAVTSKRKMAKSTTPMSVTVIKNDSEIAQNFLKKNPFQCFDENSYPMHGTIIISYKTDNQGRPIKMKVESSTHEKCNESAIEHMKKATGFDKNRGKETLRLDY
ncbi:MAG: hypothetical protein RL582_136 [Bacteroidota bacterium]|jgi:hypothetical protein